MNEKSRNFTPFIVILSIVINVIVAILFFLPEYGGELAFDVTIFPLLNAVFNSFTFVFLCCALYFVKAKNIKLHRRFIISAFVTTALFLVSYVTYHYLTESTSYGGEGIMRGIYFFVLITHILLAIAIVPLALISLSRGLQMQVEKHRRIARITMPIWLYVSLTGVLVYLMISPYY